MNLKLQSFTVLPTTPEKLKPLLEIASNLWFSWNWDAIQLFEKLDEQAWKAANKNPLRMLCDMPQQKLEAKAQDKDYIAELEAVYTSFKKYLASKTWFDDQFGKRDKETIAYFSCEFGLHESLPIYSGGLGILAGDHLKSASDLGLPLVAIGFLYRQGYFRQGLNAEGMQQEFYPENDWFSMPVSLVKNEHNDPIVLSMDIGGEDVFFQIWKVDVGRIALYLMDTNLQQNTPHNRDITKRLYDADRDTRLRQEVLLGIGGVKALRALGKAPQIFHINEGHSAFLLIERLRELMEDHGLSFQEAKEVVWASNLFTTHTPVPAGNEHFEQGPIKKYLSRYVQKHLGLSISEFLALGLKTTDSTTEEFSMTVFALRFSSSANGVSKLHGVVSREMWKSLFPGTPEDEVPIGHITNGVHTPSFLSMPMERLFARYMNTAYMREIADFTIWKVVDKIPNQFLWQVHCEQKKALIDYCRERLRFQLRRRGANAGEINKVKEVLDPNILTIGFARRFATYKRGTLLNSDIKRLEKIVTHAKHPVQIIYAGKAHPADSHGKEIIQKIFKMAGSNPELSKRIVFLEDYDIDMAKMMVQGVDVWLNNPRRPREASGTSGMKAAMNGAPNLSVLDGWWDEAFDHTHGWAIGHGENYTDENYQDEVESNLLYRLIENEVCPLFYDNRNESAIPMAWVEMMKKTIKSCGEGFNAHRMVSEYVRRYYLKGEKFYKILVKNDFAEAKNLAHLHNKLRTHWKDIEILEVGSPLQEVVYSGTEVCITAKIKLAAVDPTDIVVEVYHGTLDADDKIKAPRRVRMSPVEKHAEVTVFKAMIPCDLGGRYGYTVRILPGNENLASEFLPGLIKWKT
ncbi:MAG: alpha-glucan family phosphorylase [Pseudomonadota bacterium]